MPIRLPQASWTDLCLRVARAEPPIAWSWAAVRDQQDIWRLAGLCVRSATSVPSAVLRYPGVAIGSEAVSARTAASRLRRRRLGVRGNWASGLDVPAFDGLVCGDWCFGGESTMYLGRSDWPQFYIHHSFGEGVMPGYAPLSAPGQVYYPTFTAALAERVFGVAPPDMQHYPSPALIISLPDRRARIASLTPNDDAVAVTIASAAGSLDGLRLQAAWRSEPRDVRWRHHQIEITAPGVIDVPTSGIPSEMAVALSTPAGNVLDQRGWHEQAVPEPTGLPDLGALVGRWLAEGEGQRLEFKQELKSETARVSFAETIAAFANGDGGTVLVGVGDDGTVVGYRPPKVADQLTEIARTLVVEPVTIGIDEVTIDGRFVQVVHVAPGDPTRRPYRCRDRAMIRANATTRVATTFEIRGLTATDPNRLR